MTVRCAQCGEEMLGAVNRCWRCGNPLTANATQPDLPPQRRPVESPAVNIAPDPTAIAEAEILSDETINESETTNAEAVASDVPPVREMIAPQVRSAPVPDEVKVYRHPSHHPTAATGGALGALLLGAISLVVSWFTFAGALLSLAGLGLGAWGVSSNRRETAIIGMLLCCVALLFSGYTGAIAAYKQIYGYSPWESSLPVNDYPEPIDGEVID